MRTKEELLGLIVRFAETCPYSYNCYNCSGCVECEICNTCFSCIKCYSCLSCYHCIECNECTDCNSCINCSKQENKRYMIDNIQFTEQEYYAILHTMYPNYLPSQSSLNNT